MLLRRPSLVPFPTYLLRPELDIPLPYITVSPQLLPIYDILSNLPIYLIYCVSPPLECELYKNLHFVQFLHDVCVPSAQKSLGVHYAKLFLLAPGEECDIEER